MVIIKKIEEPKGFVALLMVLVTGAVGVAVATSVVLSGVNSSRNGFLLKQSKEAMAVADACAEKGLEAVRDNPGFSGSANLALGSGNCSYTVSVLAGENRVVEAWGAVGNVRRKVRVDINAVKPKINVSSWKEIP